MASPSQQTTASAQPPGGASGTPRFQVVKFLGKGGQGFVQLALDTLTGQYCAVKYIDRGWSRSFYKYTIREILNHASLSLCKHPHICEFLEVFLTPRYLGVVMEYVDGSNLQQYLEANGGRLEEDVARFIFQQLMIAVDFCHKNGKVNRDIKLANVLLQLNGNQLPLVKLCDFGFSKDKFDDSEPQTQIGTALFTAPEIFTNTQGQVYDAEAADVWSCGVVLYVMLCGGHPFLGSDDCRMKKHAQVMKLIENSVNGRLMWPEGSQPSVSAADLIRHVLVSKPSERYKIGDILQHPWFLEKLPPGALVLNDAYLSMRVSPSEARQTPEAIKQIVRAAVSVNSSEVMDRGGAGGMTATTSVGGVLGGGGGLNGLEASAAMGVGGGQAGGLPEASNATSAAPGPAMSNATAQSSRRGGSTSVYRPDVAGGLQIAGGPGVMGQPATAAHMGSQGRGQPLQAQSAWAGGAGDGQMGVDGQGMAGISAMAADSHELKAELQRLISEGSGALPSNMQGGLLGASPGMQQGMGMSPAVTMTPDAMTPVMPTNGMDISGNVLLDSSILMQMNLAPLADGGAHHHA